MALTSEDDYFFTSYLYVPNILYYRKVLAAFGKEAEEKDYKELFSFEDYNIVF